MSSARATLLPLMQTAHRKLRHAVGRTWLSAFGWTLEDGVKLPPKAVVIACPHTSNWDFPFTLAVSYALDLDFSWLGKHTLFDAPYGFFFRLTGGIPVDRRDRNNAVSAVIEILKGRDELMLIVAPEGTRSQTRRWKTGFYYIALGAGVPIVLGFLDYGKKRGGVLHVFHPTGDLDADMASIRAIYAPIEGKHPSRMSEITLGSSGAIGSSGAAAAQTNGVDPSNGAAHSPA